MKTIADKKAEFVKFIAGYIDFEKIIYYEVKKGEIVDTVNCLSSYNCFPDDYFKILKGESTKKLIQKNPEKWEQVEKVVKVIRKDQLLPEHVSIYLLFINLLAPWIFNFFYPSSENGEKKGIHTAAEQYLRFTSETTWRVKSYEVELLIQTTINKLKDHEEKLSKLVDHEDRWQPKIL
jgi:hypothetical protein